MTKVTLNNVGSLIDATTAATTINGNFDTIETAFDNTLSRNGAAPNQMLANLDINGHKIVNLPNASANGEAINFQQFVSATTPTALIINSSTLLGGMSGGILFNNGGTLSNTDLTGSANLFTSGTLNIHVPAGAPRAGLDLTTSLTGGPYTGAIYSNVFECTSSSVVQGGGIPGTPTAPNWALIQFSGSVGSGYNTKDLLGADVVGQAFSVSAGMVTNAANNTYSDLVGGSFGYFNNFNMPNSRGYGITASATVGATGTTPIVIAGEFASSIISGGVSLDRYGINILSYFTGTASRLNTAISVQRGNPGGEFSQVITLNPYADGTTQPMVLKTTGDVIYVPTAQTFNSFINAPTAIVSYVYNTKNALLTGAGVLSLGSATSPGGTVIIGGASDALNTTYQYVATPKWTVGASSSLYFITAVGLGSNALQIDNTTNLVTFPLGATVNGNFTLGGSTSGGIILKAPAIAGSNTITFPAGSTNFTATGGAGQVVKQSTAGGGFTVATVGASELSGLGTGVATALAVNVGSAGAFVTFNGALGTPSSGTLTNATGLPISTGVSGLGTGVAASLVVSTGNPGAFVVLNGPAGTPTSLTLTNATGLPVSGITASTVTALGVGSIELGHATDTTLARASAGRLSVEGVNVVTASSTDTLTNKTFDSAGTGNVLQVSSVTVSRGQYPGTNTTGNATAGNIGEMVESTVLAGSAVSLTTATAANVTSISLTAGDWDVWGNVCYVAGGTTNILITDAWISATSATLPVSPNAGAINGWTGSVAGFAKALFAGMTRITVGSTTTIFLETQATFNTSTLAAYGYIGARRVR